MCKQLLLLLVLFYQTACEVDAKLNDPEMELQQPNPTGVPNARLESDLRQAEYHLSQGNIEETQSLLDEVKKLDGIAGGEYTADIAIIEGNLLVLQGNYVKAEQVLFSALQQRTKNVLKAVIFNNLANIFSYQKRYIDAHEYYQQAIELGGSLGAAFLSKTEINQIRILLMMGRAKEAGQKYNRLIPVLRNLPEGSEKPALLISAAEILSMPGASGITLRPRATQYLLLDQAARLSKTDNLTYSHARALLGLGHMYLADERFDNALRLTRQALFGAVSINSTELVTLCYWQMARAYRERNQYEHSLEYYRRAVMSVDSQPGNSNIESISIFRASLDELLREAADLLLKKASQTKNKKKRTELLLEARAVIEKYQEDRLYSYYQDECVAQVKSRTAGDKEVNKDVLVIYPIILDDRLEIIVSGKNAIKQFTVNLPTQQLKLAVQNLRANLEDSHSKIYKYSATEVYDWLVRPIESFLRDYSPKTLVFIPNATIQMVPLGVLYDGKHHLIERYAIATTPGLLLTMTKQKKQAVKMLVGAAQYVENDMSRLPSAIREAKKLAQNYDAFLLLDDKFTKKNLDQAVREQIFPIIHIATHSQIDTEEKGTYLLTHNGRIGLDDIQKLLTEGRYQDTPVEILTLSACSTATTDDDRSGLGLGGLAVKSGARTVLASLWRIDDEATQVLMDKFYFYLGKNIDNRAKALQQAQKDLLVSSKYQHPYFWSAFVLIGSWQ